MPRFSIRARPEPSEAAGNTYSDPHPDDSIDEMVVGAGCDGDWCAGGAPCAAAHPPLPSSQTVFLHPSCIAPSTQVRDSAEGEGSLRALNDICFECFWFDLGLC